MNQQTQQEQVKLNIGQRNALKREQEASKQQLAKQKQNEYYQNYYKDKCEQLEVYYKQQIEELQKKINELQQELFQYQQQYFATSQQNQITSQLTQANTEVTIQEPSVQILQEYPEQSVEQQSQPSNLETVKRFRDYKQKRWNKQEKLVHILRFQNLGTGRYHHDYQIIMKYMANNEAVPCARTVQRWKENLVKSEKIFRGNIGFDFRPINDCS
ncbi:Hypothetical_protein [Hexamita inflata]|uniref:Hypothetical_protein n=1 Tax=Hexamita inflata TaxID=28002 RepID=A0ABP1HMX7_9EUKA